MAMAEGGICPLERAYNEHVLRLQHSTPEVIPEIGSHIFIPSIQCILVLWERRCQGERE